jgi:hypothetical protein
MTSCIERDTQRPGLLPRPTTYLPLFRRLYPLHPAIYPFRVLPHSMSAMPLVRTGPYFQSGNTWPPRHQSDSEGPDWTRPHEATTRTLLLLPICPSGARRDRHRSSNAILLPWCIPISAIDDPSDTNRGVVAETAFHPDGLYLSPHPSHFAFGSRKSFGLEPINHHNLIPVESMESNPTPPASHGGMYIIPFPPIPVENVNAQPVHRHSYHCHHCLQKASFIEILSHALMLLGPWEGRSRGFCSW